MVPYSMGNTHPRFWGWYMGAGTPFGALGDFLASMLNPNMGGGDHGADHVEDSGSRLVQGHRRPAARCGRVARERRLDGQSHRTRRSTQRQRRHRPARGRRRNPGGAHHLVRLDGGPQLRAEVARAAWARGARALRKVAVDRDYRIDLRALEQMIAADRAAGLQPVCVIGARQRSTRAPSTTSPPSRRSASANGSGSASTAPSALCWRCRHVIALSWPEWNARIRSRSTCTSGCRCRSKPAAHWSATAMCTTALSRCACVHEHAARGIPGGSVWYSDYGIRLSRGFRALKVWLSFKEHGTDRYAALIEATASSGLSGSPGSSPLPTISS